MAKESDKNLREEIAGLLGEIDKEGLLFLRKQARTLIYNRKVVETDAAARALNESIQREAESGTGGKKKGKKTTKKTTPPAVVRIDEGEGLQHFNLVFGNSRIFINRGEMKALAKICEAAASPAAGAASLYRWSRRERSDLLNDAGIAGPGDTRLVELYRLISENYTAGG